MRLLLIAGLLALSTNAVAAATTAGVTVPQGGIGHWAGGDATSCHFGGKRYLPVAGDCYFPIDMARAPGRYAIAKRTAQGRQNGLLTVTATDFPEETIDFPDTRYVTPGATDLRRIRRETAQIRPLFWRSGGTAAQFTLPLGKPSEPLPAGDNFGYRRVFNGLAKSPHTGVDYAIGAGTSVKAAADGKVVLVADHFFSGNSVYVDHGDGLVTEYFHLGETTVQTGQAVHKGDEVGKVGQTGRATGPHLHFGARWHGMRIDPNALFGDPGQLPSVN